MKRGPNTLPQQPTVPHASVSARSRWSPTWHATASVGPDRRRSGRGSIDRRAVGRYRQAPRASIPSEAVPTRLILRGRRVGSTVNVPSHRWANSRTILSPLTTKLAPESIVPVSPRADPDSNRHVPRGSQSMRVASAIMAAVGSGLGSTRRVSQAVSPSSRIPSRRRILRSRMSWSNPAMSILGQQGTHRSSCWALATSAAEGTSSKLEIFGRDRFARGIDDLEPTLGVVVTPRRPAIHLATDPGDLQADLRRFHP